MPRPKSLIVSMAITVAGNSHNCRHNDGHRIPKGAKRLTVSSDGDKHHYCLSCAKTFLTKDVDRLRVVLAEVDADTSVTSR